MTAIWLRPDEPDDFDDLLQARGFQFRALADAHRLSRGDALRWSTLTCVRDQLAAIMDGGER